MADCTQNNRKVITALLALASVYRDEGPGPGLSEFDGDVLGDQLEIIALMSSPLLCPWRVSSSSGRLWARG